MISRYQFTRTAKKLLFNVFNIFFTNRKPPGTISFVRTQPHTHARMHAHARTRARLQANSDPSFTCFCTNLGGGLAYIMFHMYLPRSENHLVIIHSAASFHVAIWSYGGLHHVDNLGAKSVTGVTVLRWRLRSV